MSRWKISMPQLPIRFKIEGAKTYLRPFYLFL